MKLKSIHLRDFRNYESLDLSLNPNINVFIGDNAQGKTNLLESIYFLSTGRSHRIQDEALCIRSNQMMGMCRAVVEHHGEIQLKVVIHDKGKTFKVILEILEEKLGYKVFHKVLNTMTHANVPQNRERIFVVAFDPNQVPNYANFQFPEEIKLTKTIHDILDKEKQENKYYYPKTHQYYPELVKTMTSKDTVYQWRRVYVRENKSNVCPTLTANMGAGGHNVPLIKDDFGIRKLTPKECFAFQGYPMDKYILPPIANSKLYMQAGNSVTTTLIERISNEIINVL